MYEKEITDIKATLDNSDDVNLMRLRKAHSALKKEFTKAAENHKKETETIRKDKKRLEEELRTATIENRNQDEGKTTMNDFFKCLKEIPGKSGRTKEITVVNAETGAKKKYSCDKCDFTGTDNTDLNKH